MICVECGQPVNNVHHRVHGAEETLTRCEYCKKVADKYVEYELVIIFLDLVLHKPQAYRHVIFNRMEYSDAWLSFRDVQLAFFIIVLEAYHQTQSQHQGGWADLSPAKSWKGYTPTLEWWKEFGLLMVLSSIQLLLLCLASIVTARALFARKFPIVKYNYLAKSIILSHFGRCFFALVMVWDYDNPRLLSVVVDLFVLTSNMVAVHVWTGAGVLPAALIVTVGWTCRLALYGAVAVGFDWDPAPNLLRPLAEPFPDLWGNIETLIQSPLDSIEMLLQSPVSQAWPAGVVALVAPGGHNATCQVP